MVDPLLKANAYQSISDSGSGFVFFIDFSRQRMLSALGAGGPSLVADSVRVILGSCAARDHIARSLSIWDHMVDRCQAVA